MNAIAMITARGGSKRIPRKNIKSFLGKPILVYSIAAALQSGIFEEVMVSTDDKEIAEIAKAAGAKVPFLRSEKTAGDFATTGDVITEVLDEYAKCGRSFEYGCCIYPTAPFVTAAKLSTGMEMLHASDADCVIPVVSFSYPPQRALVIENDMLIFRQPEFMDSRSQDLQPWYHDVGQFYCFRSESFRKSGKLMVGKILPMIVPELEVQDIDTLSDWEIAEIKYQKMKESEK